MGLSFPSRREGVGLAKVSPASRPKRLSKSVDTLLDKRLPFALGRRIQPSAPVKWRPPPSACAQPCPFGKLRNLSNSTLNNPPHETHVQVTASKFAALGRRRSEFGRPHPSFESIKITGTRNDYATTPDLARVPPRSLRQYHCCGASSHLISPSSIDG